MGDSATHLLPEQIAHVMCIHFGNERIVIEANSQILVGREGARVVAFPHDLLELSEMLRLALSERWRVIPFGAGTWLEMGNRATDANLFISTAHLNRIIEYEPADLTATVEAGCTLASFNAQAAAARQFLPFDPFGDERATLGAIVATNSFGPLRCAYGTPRDWVIGMRIVHADGRITKAGGKVVKNVAGYDLCKLYTGSFGTLGVIGELSFKLRALPSTERTVICAANEISVLIRLVERINDSDLQPAAMELFSPRAIGLGDFVSKTYALALRFLDEPEMIEAQQRDLTQFSGDWQHFVLSETDAVQLWYAYRENEIAPHWAYSFRVSVLPADIAVMIAEIERLMPAATLCAHASTGVIRLHTNAAWFDDFDIARRVIELRQIAQSRGGQLVIMRAPEMLRSQLDVWGEVGSAVQLMRELKAKFDPQSQLNPGRFVAGI